MACTIKVGNPAPIAWRDDKFAEVESIGYTLYACYDYGAEMGYVLDRGNGPHSSSRPVITFATPKGLQGQDVTRQCLDHIANRIADDYAADRYVPARQAKERQA